MNQIPLATLLGRGPITDMLIEGPSCHDNVQIEFRYKSIPTNPIRPEPRHSRASQGHPDVIHNNDIEIFC